MHHGYGFWPHAGLHSSGAGDIESFASKRAQESFSHLGARAIVRAEEQDTSRHTANSLLTVYVLRFCRYDK
jgi:hypothetical protein